MDTTGATKLISRQETRRRFGNRSEAWLDDQVKRRHGFPQPVRLPGSRAVLFVEAEVEDYLRTRIEAARCAA